MKYPVLSKVANKDEYVKYMDQFVRFGRRIVKVTDYTTHGRQGSYERGLKFRDTKYGILVYYKNGKPVEATGNHGLNWVYLNCGYISSRFMSHFRKGKVKLNTRVEKEFAFEAIQEINRKWDGPGFRWRP